MKWYINNNLNDIFIWYEKCDIKKYHSLCKIFFFPLKLLGNCVDTKQLIQLAGVNFL